MALTIPGVPDDVVAQLVRLSRVITDRTGTCKLLRTYDEGCAPVPQAVVRARVTKAYTALMEVADAPWGSLVIDSVQDRLEVQGISSSNAEADKAVWAWWQDNGLDAESKLAHRSTLIDGRAFAIVWPDREADNQPIVTYEDATQVAIEYRPGSRRIRRAALRRWVDEDTGLVHATLYRPDGLWKFERPKDTGHEDERDAQTTHWQIREVPGEAWPAPNKYRIVPVVELAVNRRLKPGRYGYARGEYEHCIGLIDRINLLTFLGLVVAFWQGFPLRAVIGDEIKQDDDGNDLPPFKALADSVAQFEDPDTKFAEFSAADRRNLSVYGELDQLAVITKTPRHYFPLEQGMSNISADAIRASEGGLHAKTTGHKASLGEGHEEIARIAGIMLPDPVELPRDAALKWSDSESRSLAERADAASKLVGILPPAALIERVLNVSQDEASRLSSLAAADALTAALTATAPAPAPTPAPAPAPAV